MKNVSPAEQNMAILSVVAIAIGSLRDSLVFVGGCATGLLVTNVRAQPIRVTIDVDLVAHVTSRAEYRSLEREFESLGFAHDLTANAPICRWRKNDVIVDLMPTDESILGFHNRWYEHAIATANSLELPNGLHIKLINAPVFIATKIEAFKGRGNNDFLDSHDLEDVITVIDGRNTLLQEVESSELDLRLYLKHEFSSLLSDPRFTESLHGHLPGDPASQRRVPLLRSRMRALSELEL
jgi:predicted nucleotidyltransferase